MHWTRLFVFVRLRCQGQAPEDGVGREVTFRKLGFRFPDRRSIDTAGFGDPSRKQVLQLVQIRGARQLITATYVYEHPQVGRVVLEDGNDQAARAAFEAIIAEHFSGNDTSEWIEVRYTRLERR